MTMRKHRKQGVNAMGTSARYAVQGIMLKDTISLIINLTEQHWRITSLLSVTNIIMMFIMVRLIF